MYCIHLFFTHYQGYATSSIDVVFYNNQDSVIQSLVLPFIFSNHRFVLSSLNFDAAKAEGQFVMTRVLNEKSLNELKTELSNTDTRIIDNFQCNNEKWHVIKSLITSALNKHAPIKKIRLKKCERYPWIDNELQQQMAQRNKLYAIFNEAKVSKIGSIEWSNFKEQRKVVQTMSRAKMTDFFKEKCSKSFKTPKKYWSFYKSIVKTKKKLF